MEALCVPESTRVFPRIPRAQLQHFGVANIFIKIDIRTRVRYCDGTEGSLNSPFCRGTGQVWRKLNGFNLVKESLWKCPILLHSMVNLVILILKLYIIVILINLGFSKSQRPLCGSEINQETKENNYPGVKKAKILRAVTDIFYYHVFFFQVSPCKFSRLGWVWPSPPLSGWQLPWRSPYIAQDPCAQIGHEPSPVWREVQPDKT